MSRRGAPRSQGKSGQPLPRRRGWLLAGGGVLVLAALVVWQAAPAGGPAGGPVAASARQAPAAPVPAAIERLRAEVVASYAHDPTAYTQGLLWADGRLFESTGLEGHSSLREVELESGRILRRVALSPELFGEGLAKVGERLVQLTWRSELGLIWDAATFERVGQFFYRGEGWGLCHDGRELVMSDGSAELAFLDERTFKVRRRLRVTAGGRAADRLNELECVDGVVWANLYGSETIVRIDPGSGRVTATVDASGLLTAEEARLAEVMNGIAWVPEREVFLVTGKLWPRLFAVRFVAASSGDR